MSTDYSSAKAAYQHYAAQGLALDITRGKPSPAQLDLSRELLTAVSGDEYLSPSGVDTRNYGGLEGLRELREFFAAVAGVPAAQLLVHDNSSLALMGLTLQFHLLFGTSAGQAWAGGPHKILCPIPGYDRHFGVAEHLGFELISVPMDDEGPDLDAVAQAVKDPAVKGIWIVPVYSNPSGLTISADRARALAELDAAAPDFRILWDNAYAVHHLTDEEAVSPAILDFCAQAGNPDRVWMYGSTSKITFAGAGVSYIASSAANIDWFKQHLGAMSIGPDKINQLRHLKFFTHISTDPREALRTHMRRHAEIMAPKFAAVEEILQDKLGGTGLAEWTTPLGGYFITLKVRPGLASRVVELAAQAGVKLTPAGATHPYGKDPEDTYIRIAPSMPELSEVKLASEVLAACVLLAAAEQDQS